MQIRIAHHRYGLRHPTQRECLRVNSLQANPHAWPTLTEFDLIAIVQLHRLSHPQRVDEGPVTAE
jgi:hypothetical protein